MNTLLNIDVHKNKYIYLYYLFLHLLCLSWTNTGMVQPPLILRLLVTSAVFLPLIKYFWLTPSVIILFCGIRFNSVAPFGYVPQSWDIYSYLIIAIAVLHQLIYKDIVLKLTKKQTILLVCLIVIQLFNISYFIEIITFYIALFILYNSLKTSTSLNVAMLSFVLLSLSLSIYYFLFKDVFLGFYGSLDDRSTWVDPNYFGHLLGIGVVLSFYYLLNNSKIKTPLFVKVLLGFCLILAFVVIILQASRGAFLAVSLTLGFIILSSKINLRYKIFSVFILLILTLYLLDSGIFDLVLSRFSEGDVSGSNRTEIWSEKLDTFVKFSFMMFGTGYPASVVDYPPYGSDCHNEFVSILLNYGIVGIIFLFIEIFKLLFLRRKVIIVSCLTIYVVIAFLTLSPITCQAGWCGVPLLLPILYRLSK